MILMGIFLFGVSVGLLGSTCLAFLIKDEEEN